MLFYHDFFLYATKAVDSKALDGYNKEKLPEFFGVGGRRENYVGRIFENRSCNPYHSSG